jgi:hypothetical protein
MARHEDESLTWGQAACSTCQGPDTQTDGYQSKRIVSFAALCKYGRRDEEADLHISNQGSGTAVNRDQAFFLSTLDDRIAITTQL